MKPEERLIVAADFKPSEHGGFAGAKSKVIELAEQLEALGVIIKLNSILRADGYDLIRIMRNLGLEVMADLKLVDIPNTMSTDGELLAEYKPKFVTAMCCAGAKGLKQLDDALGADTTVMGVTVLTSLNPQQSELIFSCSPKAGVLRFASIAKVAGLTDLVMSPKEVHVLDENMELGLAANTPGIRPEWSLVKGDDQSRVMTITKAIQTGSKRLVIGRPITQAASPRDAVHRSLDEIAKAQEELG